MFKITELSKIYNGVKVLDVPKLQIEAGESFGLVGNNGAGKTTFFRSLLDLIKPESGNVLSKDKNVCENNDWKHYTGSYLDENFLIDFLTPDEYFEFVARINGLSDGDLKDFYERFNEFFNEEILEKKKYIRELSRGNQNKVGIAAAFMTEPEVIILDEPFNSLDPSTQIRLKNMIHEIKKDTKTTILISSHDLNHVTEVCERIVILDKGKIVHDLKTSDNTLKELEAYFAV